MASKCYELVVEDELDVGGEDGAAGPLVEEALAVLGAQAAVLVGQDELDGGEHVALAGAILRCGRQGSALPRCARVCV